MKSCKFHSEFLSSPKEHFTHFERTSVGTGETQGSLAHYLETLALCELCVCLLCFHLRFLSRPAPHCLKSCCSRIRERQTGSILCSDSNPYSTHQMIFQNYDAFSSYFRRVFIKHMRLDVGSLCAENHV